MHKRFLSSNFWSETSNISLASKMVSFATRIRVTNEELWNRPIFVHIQRTVFEVKLLISPIASKMISFTTRIGVTNKDLWEKHIHWVRFSEPILHAWERKIEGKNCILEKYKTLWKERNELSNASPFKVFLSFWLKFWENFFEIRKQIQIEKRGRTSLGSFGWILICLTILIQICEI